MTTKTVSFDFARPAAETQPSPWKGIYSAGAVAALVVVLAGLVDISIMFLPGTGFEPGGRAAVDWFAAYHENALLALRDMGVLNMVTTFSTVLVFFALFGAHRKAQPAAAGLAAPAGLAVIILCMGTTIYIANNMALPMLSLSSQYAAADSDSERALLVSAGQVLLAQEDVGAGSFIGFFLPELAGVLMALVMLRGRIFSRWAGWAGLLGEALLIAFNITAAFIPGLYNLALVFSMIGGPLAMAWFVMIAVGLRRLS